jgi:hypothetical protein
MAHRHAALSSIFSCNLAMSLFEEVWNKGNLQVTDELFTPNAVR